MKNLALALTFAVAAAAQAAPPLPDSNFIYVVGYGEVSVEPDRARIEVTVRASGPDHEKAFAQLQADSKAVMAQALALGVDPKNIDAHRIGKSNRERGNGGQSLPELEQTVQFELRDLDTAVALADRVLKLQSVHEVSTSFFVKDSKDAEAKATALAAADAQQRAQTLAKLFGRKLGRTTAVAMESNSSMRARFGDSMEARSYEVQIAGGFNAADHRVPNGIEFNARLYVIYALD